MVSMTTSKPLQLADWCRRDALTGDASPRRYSRLWAADDRSAILVEYPAGIRSRLADDLEVLYLFQAFRETGSQGLI